MNRAQMTAAVVLPASLAALISPPFGWLFLHPFVFALPFFVFARSKSPRWNFFHGWAAGAVIYLVLFPWLPETVVRFSKLPLWAGVIAYLLFCAASGLFTGVFALGFRRVQRASGRAWPLGLAFWFTACEFLNPQVIPFYQATPWYEVSSVFLAVSAFGMSGGTFLLILANAVVLQAFEVTRARRESASPARSDVPSLAFNALVLLAGVAIALGVSKSRASEIQALQAAGDSLTVAIAQTNTHGEGRRRLRARGGAAAIANDQIELSRHALERFGKIDAFVWPESALSAEPGTEQNAAVLAFARETGSEIWTGAGYAGRHDDGPTRPFNSAFRIDANGEVDRRYDKISLIPFGEYVPLREFFPALARIKGLGRYVPGTEDVIYDASTRFAFLICYEAIVSGRLRDVVDDGAGLLVNVTYDGWFADSAAPEQHLMLVAAQAAQYGIPVVRSAGTGISAVIDASGRITNRSQLFKRQLIVARVALPRVPSIYSKYGDWFAMSCVLVSSLVLARSLLSDRPRASQRGNAE